MRRLPAFGRILAIILALVLAAVKCPAEGLLFAEQTDSLTAESLSTRATEQRDSIVHDSSLFDSGAVDDSASVSDTQSTTVDSAGAIGSVDSAQVTPATPPGGSTVVFPIVGLAALLIVSVQMRRNNVFRQNLKRVMLHPHGFNMDLRFRRFLHTAQPLLLVVLEAVACSLMLVSVMYAFRGNIQFDRYLTQFMPLDRKIELLTLIGNPTQAIAYFALVFLGLIVALTVLVRLVSVPFRERMDLWQAANYVVWSLAAVLVTLPLGAILFRVLETPKFITPALVFLGLVLLWTLQRLLSALRVGFGSSAWKVYLAVMLIAGVIIIGGAAVLNRQLGTLAYLDHFHRVLGTR